VIIRNPSWIGGVLSSAQSGSFIIPSEASHPTLVRGTVCGDNQVYVINHPQQYALPQKGQQ
jgi:hypothetical protein